MNVWSDDDGLWEAMTPALAAPARVTVAEADVASIVCSLDLQPGAAVLDLACGAGAHAIAFAARGFDVTAVDRTAHLLRIAEERASERGLDVVFVRADMRDHLREEAFDAVCILGSSFGFFGSRTNRAVLGNVRRSLRGGGALVLDVIARESLLHHWQERTWQEVSGVLYLVHRTLSDDCSILTEEWIVVTGSVRRDLRTVQHVYAASELRDLLHETGFERVELAAGFDSTVAYQDTARRLVAFARCA